MMSELLISAAVGWDQAPSPLGILGTLGIFLGRKGNSQLPKLPCYSSSARISSHPQPLSGSVQPFSGRKTRVGALQSEVPGAPLSLNTFGIVFGVCYKMPFLWPIIFQC